MQESDIMRTFDEIFQINSPKGQSKLVSPTKEDSNKKFFKKKTSATNEVEIHPIKAEIQQVKVQKKESVSLRKDDSKEGFFEDDV